MADKPTAAQHASGQAARDTDMGATPASQAASASAGASADEAAPEGAAWSFDVDLAGLLADAGVAYDPGEASEQDTLLAAEIEARESGSSRVVDITAQVGEQLPAGPFLAAWLTQCPSSDATDFELPGLAASYRKLASWAQAAELTAVAEIAARSAAASDAKTAGNGMPLNVPDDAVAQVGLALEMTQAGATAWVDLAMRLRWRLPGTGTALAAGDLDLQRSRIIADGTSVLSDEQARVVEEHVLPAAPDQTTGQLRASVHRAVIAADPEGAEERRKNTERLAKVSLYPDPEGTAALNGTCLPGVHAAAAMARITAMARALRASGAPGGLDLLRAQIYLGLLLGTMPLIPPPADGPPEGPPPPDDDPADGPPPPDDPADGPLPADESPGAWLPPDGHPGCPDSARERAGGPGPADGPPGDAVPAPAGTGAGSGCRQAGGSGVDDGCLPGPWADIPCPGDKDAPPEDPGETADPPPWFSRFADDQADAGDWAVSPDWPVLPDQLPATGTGAMSRRPWSLRGPAGLLDVLMPWSALAGISSEPAILGRIGPITRLQGRQLLILAARSPQTEWRVIVTDDDGRALAVTRARVSWQQATGPPASSGSGTPEHPGVPPSSSTPSAAATCDSSAATTSVVGRVTVTIQASWLGTPHAAGLTGLAPLPQIGAAVLRAAARAADAARADAEANAAAGGCAHNRASELYRPPPRIRELVAARDRTCRYITCGQPAWRADLDHTKPWHKGGLTCMCNLGGCCRTHHKLKQRPGWSLEQPQPGVFRWTTPAGRTYLTKPDPYPV